MKMFLRLSLLMLLCLGFTLMLVGDVTYAASHQPNPGAGGVVANVKGRLSVEKDPPGPYDITKKVPVTVIFTLEDKDGNPAQGVELDFTYNNVTPVDTGNYDASGNEVSSGNAAGPATTGNDGKVWVKIRTQGKPNASVRTLWADANLEGIALFDNFEEEPPPPPEPTTLIVLPPIPCDLDYGVLDNMPTPLSKLVKDLEKIDTYDKLLKAIKPERDKLEGLAARWDDMDPNANPDDPDDMDSPPNEFRVPIVILNAKDLSGWQFDIAYNPQILEVIEVSGGGYAIYEGDFLKQGSAMTFFQPANEVNNAAGEIIRISQTRIATGDEVNNTKADLVPQGSAGWAAEIAGRKPTDSIDGADGTGELVSICFRVKEFAEESLGLHNLQLSDSVGNRLDFTTIVHPIVVTHQFAPEDVNRDTVVNTKDLMVIAANLGLAKPINPRADVNNDGIVNALDLVIVAQHIMDRTPAVKVRDRNMPAPAIPGSVAALDLATIQGWIDMAHLEDDGSAIFDLGIANLETLLASRTPSETKLLLNYPNPFNPETWIPYQLAEATEVAISIYAVNGNLVRTLALGHQAAGIYQSKSQAAYWNGRNGLGERVASGVYFYTFTAGKFSATGKMLVRK